MYIRKIQVNDYGAIEKMDYMMPFSEEGNPLPVVQKSLDPTVYKNINMDDSR